MIPNDKLTRLAEYWRKEKVLCVQVSLAAELSSTEFGVIWEKVGMPCQEWWPFRFSPPSKIQQGQPVEFGMIGANWRLHFSPDENVCFATDEHGRKRFGNSSFIAFANCLCVFDEYCKRIQRECGGDSGDDWSRGDVILEKMKDQIHSIDPKAFEVDSNLWLHLLDDLNG